MFWGICILIAICAATGAVPDHNIVTPLLPKNYKQAQANSRVKLPGGWNATDLYSGFFTVDESTDSNS